MSKSVKRFAFGTIIAAIAGYIAGILTAPKSGKETREDIKHAAEVSITEGEKQLKKLHTQLDRILEDAQQFLAKAEGKVRKELEQTIATTKATKEKVRQMLSNVHDGETNADELKKAIADAADAVEHLKKAIKKSV